MCLQMDLMYTDPAMITLEGLDTTTIDFLIVIYPYMPIFSNLRASHVPADAPLVH